MELDKILEKFEDYCILKRNVTFERHRFFTWVQKTGETVDQYVTDLRNRSKTCEFGELTDAAFTPKRTESQFRAGARASSKLVPALPQLRTGWFHTGQSQPWSRREQRHDVTANVSASELGQKHTADIFLYSGWK